MDELDTIETITLNDKIVVRCRACAAALGEYPFGSVAQDPEGFKTRVVVPLARKHQAACTPRPAPAPVAGRVGSGGSQGCQSLCGCGCVCRLAPGHGSHHMCSENTCLNTW